MLIQEPTRFWPAAKLEVLLCHQPLALRRRRRGQVPEQQLLADGRRRHPDVPAAILGTATRTPAGAGPRGWYPFTLLLPIEMGGQGAADSLSSQVAVRPVGRCRS